MSFSVAETLFLQILRDTLHDGTVTKAVAASEMNELLRLAQRHHVLPLVYTALYDADAFAGKQRSFRQVKQTAVSQAVRQYVQNSDFQSLYAGLREAGLHPICVKGPLCAGLYRNSAYRITSDYDLLIREAEFSRCHGMLQSLGLCADAAALQNREYEVSYHSEDGSLCIELHRSLFAQDDGALNVFFEDAFDTMTDIDGYFSLNPHSHFLFLLLHAYKHFIFSGVGVRQVCDIGLWEQAYGSEIDWELLYDQCASVHTEVFAAALFHIAEAYLGFSMPLTKRWREISVDVEPMLQDMLDGGVYGAVDRTRLHTATVTSSAVRASREDRQESSTVSVLFPKRSDIQGRYPFLRKWPFLLPIAWAMRLLRYGRELLRKNSSAAQSIRLADRRMRLLEQYGILPARKKNH